MKRTRGDVAVIILAAGLGTRMKSNRAKVLHDLEGKPMILYVAEVATALAGREVIVVTGHQADEVKKVVSEAFDVRYAYQAEQRGTGHAVQCALPELGPSVKTAVILCGDVPLLGVETLEDLVQSHERHRHDITVLSVEVDVPAGYGRMIVNASGRLLKIVEEADADPVEKKINLINSGIFCVERHCLTEALNQLTPDNAQAELYLTDIVQIGNDQGKTVGTVVGRNADEVVGINSPDDLARAAALLQGRQGELS